jgi:hypothetical protein
MAERLVAVGYEGGNPTGHGTHLKTWQSPDVPAPTIRAGWSGDGGPGWILTRAIDPAIDGADGSWSPPIEDADGDRA